MPQNDQVSAETALKSGVNNCFKNLLKNLLPLTISGISTIGQPISTIGTSNNEFILNVHVQ